VTNEASFVLLEVLWNAPGLVGRLVDWSSGYVSRAGWIGRDPGTSLPAASAYIRGIDESVPARVQFENEGIRAAAICYPASHSLMEN